jgi:hypothetical protein
LRFAERKYFNEFVQPRHGSTGKLKLEIQRCLPQIAGCADRVATTTKVMTY